MIFIIRYLFKKLKFKNCKKGKTESASTNNDKRETNRLLNDKNEDND